jgi:hypothetical protein
VNGRLAAEGRRRRATQLGLSPSCEMPSLRAWQLFDGLENLEDLQTPIGPEPP